MQRQRGELVPIGESFDRLSGPVQALRDATPQARHHFTQADQVDQLVSASEADPDLGFMGRTMALCSLPRSNPGNRLRRNGTTTKPNPKPRIAAAERRVKPLTRLLRYATALRVTAPLGCGSGVWYGRKVPFGPSTRPECPGLGRGAMLSNAIK